MEPITRLEQLIHAIINEASLDLDAITRLEMILLSILNNEASTIVPVTRLEKYLVKISGADVSIPAKPITRLEMFLAKIAGEDVEPPKPITRLEMLLADWAEKPLDQLVTVTGNLPLTLPNAVQKDIHSLTRYGLCTQNGTPTPDAPVDIMCNNGALKYSANMANVNEQTALVGYYISAQGAVLPDSYNWVYKLFIPCKPNTTYTLSMSQSVYFVSISEYSTPENSGFVIRKTGSTGTNTSLTITTGANTNFLRFGANVDRAPVTLEEVLDINWMLNLGNTAMDYQPYVEGGIYAGGTHPGQNLVDLTTVTDDYYYDSSGVYTALANARLTDYIFVKSGQKYTVYVKAQRAGVAANVRCNLFDTAKTWKSQSTFSVNSGTDSVGVITPTEDGYLRVSANYAGTGAQADWSKLQIVRGEYTLATMPPYEPYTEVPYQPEVLTVSGKNLFDPTKVLFGYYRDRSTGNKQTSFANFMSSDDGYIPCLPNTAYTFVGTNKTNGTYSKYNTIYFFDSAKNYLGASSYQISQPTTDTTPSNCRYLQVRSNPLDTISVSIQEAFQRFNWQLELGSTATDYEPYQPQTASVPMLLGIGNYKDEAELINGIKTGKVGVKVFDGTESFTVSSSGAMITPIPDVAIGAPNTPINTHFALETSPTAIAVGTQRFGASGDKIYSANYYMKHPTITTVAEFKVWLADRHVILLYPLAAPTTEQTTPQHLVTHKGVNIVDSVANVEPIAAEVEYYAMPT